MFAPVIERQSLRLVHLSRIVLGCGNTKIKAFNRDSSELDIKVISGETGKVHVVLSRTNDAAVKQRVSVPLCQRVL